MHIKKRTLKKILLLIILLAIIIVILKLNNRSKIKVVNTNLQRYYSAITGHDAEILEIKKENGQYNVKIKINNQVNSNLLDDEKIKKIQSWLSFYEDFKTCLDEKGIKIFVANNQASYWQLTVLPILGKDASKYIFNCDADLKRCQDMGISVTPSVLYNGHIYPGPKIPKSFMGATDCVPANYAVVI